MATSIVESFLDRLILAKLRVRGKDLEAQLFGPRGPLADFNSKIHIAVAFGVVSPNMGEELHRLRRIRNVFAHATHHVSFETPEIAREAEGFLMLDAMAKTDAPAPLKFTGRAGYQLVARILCVMIDHDYAECTGHRLMLD